MLLHGSIFKKTLLMCNAYSYCFAKDTKNVLQIAMPYLFLVEPKDQLNQSAKSTQ